MRPVRRIIAAQVEKKSLLLFNCVNYTIPSSTSGYRLIEARTPCVPWDQGQAAGPVGEGRPPKGKGPAWAPSLGPQPGPWENIPRTVTNVERYQSAGRRRVMSIPGALTGSAHFLWEA